MKFKTVAQVVQVTFAKWNKHNAPRLGAALAFYTILSLSPLVIFVVALAGLLFSHSDAQNQILSEMQTLIGPQGEKAVEAMLINAQRPASGLFSTVVGFLTLLFGASGVFGELRAALNTIWETKEDSSAGIWGMLRERFFSFGMVLSIGFLLMVSLVLSTLLSALGKFFGSILPVPAPLLVSVNFLISFIGVAGLFGLIFKFVPTGRVAWKNIWPGAFVTALLFSIGKFALGMYLGRSSVTSPYGAAGSLIVVLIWVYYSAQLFFFGAEFTHTYATNRSFAVDGTGSSRINDVAA